MHHAPESEKTDRQVCEQDYWIITKRGFDGPVATESGRKRQHETIVAATSTHSPQTTEAGRERQRETVVGGIMTIYS